MAVGEYIEGNNIQDKLNSAPEDLINRVQEFNFTQSRDLSAQVCSDDLSFHFILLLDLNEKLNTMTGISSQQNILNEIVDLFSLQYPDAKPHQLNIKERIFLVFMKLKQDLSFSILSIFKQNNISNCSH